MKTSKHFLIINNDLKEKLHLINKNFDFINYKEYKLSWSDNHLTSNIQRIKSIANENVFIDDIDHNSLLLIDFEIIDSNKINYLLFRGKLYECSQNFIDFENFIYKFCKESEITLTYNSSQYKAIRELIYTKEKEISSTLLGEDYWESLSLLFKTLNNHCNWSILRNFEGLNDDYHFQKGEDIDILCDNMNLFIAISNAKKRTEDLGRCSYFIKIKNQKVFFDIREVGDKYFDPVWSFNMLNNKIYEGFMPVLCDIDYFFSLLYHSKLQKFKIKKEYVKRLDFLAKKINLKLPNEFIYDNKITSKLLNSFMSTYGYCYTFSDDAKRNEAFLKNITNLERLDLLSNWKVLIINLIKTIINNSLSIVYRVIKKLTKN